MKDPIEAIGRQARDLFGRSLYKKQTTSDRDHMLNKLELMLSSRRIDGSLKVDGETRKKLKQLMVDNAFGFDGSREEDPRVTAEIEKFWDTKLKQGIKNGTIKAPTKRAIELYKTMHRKIHG